MMSLQLCGSIAEKSFQKSIRQESLCHGSQIELLLLAKACFTIPHPNVSLLFNIKSICKQN